MTFCIFFHITQYFTDLYKYYILIIYESAQKSRTLFHHPQVCSSLRPGLLHSFNAVSGIPFVVSVICFLVIGICLIFEFRALFLKSWMFLILKFVGNRHCLFLQMPHGNMQCLFATPYQFESFIQNKSKRCQGARGTVTLKTRTIIWLTWKYTRKN